ncbi:MAG: phosphoribosylamine--glycine ligase [Acidimicrobiales bacterium]
MKICVVGSGGREHALADVLGRHHDVVVSPGNPGIPGSTATAPEEIDADLFVIGPEAPLVDGLADRLRAAGRPVFGPGADGAQLEGSKAWMKELLVEAGVPTAAYGAFTDADQAKVFLDGLRAPFVIKTDGLAAGKGVAIVPTRAEADACVDRYLSGEAFGDAGRTLVIEEYLDGDELSVFAACDGTRAVLMGAARDHKRIDDGDQGPNTGGMGAFSPVAEADEALCRQVMDEAIVPTLASLRRRGIDYRGFLFCGVMLCADGPRVLEYNIRFGDPEAQVVLPRLENDLGVVLAEAAAGRLVTEPRFSPDSAVTVVAASEGYPEAPRTGDAIEGLDEAVAIDGVTIYCAGVDRGADDQLITAGGRVLAVTARGRDLADARSRAYEAVDRIEWKGMHVRRDIGGTTS